MLKFKKIAAVVCAFTCAVTMLVTPNVLAAESSGVTVSLSSGVNAVVNNTMVARTFITLDLDGLNNQHTNGGNVLIKMTKGIFKSVAAKPTDFEGLLTDDDNYSNVSFDINLNTENSDYDLIGILWSTKGVPARIFDGTRAVELQLDYTDKTNKGDAIFEVLDSTFSDAAQIDICDSTGATTKMAATYASSGVKYSLASGTNVITEVEEEEPPVDDNTVAFEGFTGTKEDGVTADGSVSVAAKKSFTTSEDGTSEILWTVTLNDEDNTKRYHTSTVDFAGGADYTLGMVINGLAESLVKTIEAVLQ